MDNFLENGTVLPFGLLSQSEETLIGGFNKSYKNTALRLGIVVRSYDVTDIKNLSKLSTEYDVFVFEQNEDRGSTIVTYRNCLSSDSLGSIADYFEKTIRVKQNQSTIGTLIDTKGQNGAVVLIMCLDGMSDKAIIVSGITHPDRKTKLVNKLPFLEGEYNGVNIQVANDGSATFTFKGATNNDGVPTDSSQGNTVAKVEKDGSFQINHSTITFRLDRNGTATLTTNADVVMNVKGNANVTAEGDATIKCKNANVLAQENSIVDGKQVLLGKDAAEAVVKGDTFKGLFDAHIHPTAVGPSGPPTAPLSPSALSKKVKTE